MRDQIFKAIKSSTLSDLVEFEVPEWQATIFLRRLTVKEAMQMVSFDSYSRMLPLVALSVVDKDRNQIFTVDDLENMPASQSKVISRIANRCAELVDGDDVKKKPVNQ